MLRLKIQVLIRDGLKFKEIEQADTIFIYCIDSIDRKRKMIGNEKMIYKKWNPIDSIPSILYCEAIYDDYEGFRIILRGEDCTSSPLRIAFDVALAYRNIDEADYERTLSSIRNIEKGVLFKVENSTWVEWFKEESYGKYEDVTIRHYAIFTPNDCIDILSEFEPKVEWL